MCAWSVSALAKFLKRIRKNFRLWIQLAFTVLSNGYAAGFLQGNLYKGKGKLLCMPGLNCYSCPGALGSCPIGSLQGVLADRNYKFAFYVTGTLLIFGSLLGRLVCGWLCPFGLVQDLLYKIPFVRKLKKLPGDRWLRFLKYMILAGFVIILPLVALDIVGQGKPWFCAYVCPSGTLFAGIPLVASNPALQAALGWLFTWKMAILVVLLLLSIVVYRPFCRYLCPLGAVYGLFNPLALYRYQVDEEACVHCGACEKACPMALNPSKHPNDMECIRCGACLKACPKAALYTTLKKKK